MKRFISVFTACALTLSSVGYTEESATPARPPREVSKLEPESKFSSKRWGKYAFAAAAVVIAVVTLVLVAKHHDNNDHHHHHHHKKK